MPEYYSGQNNVLGGRPYAAPQGAERPNALLAVVILALCAAGVAALVALHPGVSQGGSDLREAVPYLVVEYADGNATAGTCCLLGPGGLAVTSRQMAFPRGVNDAPARYRAFLNSAQPAQQEVAVKIDAKPAGGGQGTSAEERHRHNWATLKLDAGAKALPALRADADPAKLVEGRRVWLAGYDPDGKHLELQRLEAKIAKVQKDGANVTRFTYTTVSPIPKGFDGAPVVDAETGHVLAINCHGEAFDGGEGGDWALPIAAVTGLAGGGEAKK